MKIRPEDPDYSSFDDFSKQHGDEDLAKRLTSLFRGLEQGTVVIFNGGWGVGKTTFVRRWISHLSDQNIPSVYLDAFSVDYLESPFIAVAGAIAGAIEEAHKKNDPKSKRFMRAAAKVGRGLAATATKIGIRAATLGIVDAKGVGEDLSKVIESASDAASDYAEESVRKLIESHADRQREVAALRESLADLPALLAPTSNIEPLIVVIDELDRCRPDFALGLLEILKHFFRAPKTHFVLVSNRAQVENSIKHRYGSVDAVEYLRKFYDFEIDYDLDHSERNDSKISQYIARVHNALMPNIEDGRYIKDYIRDMSRAHNLSLRDIENIYTNLSLAYAIMDTRYRPTVLVAVLCLIKVISPSTYSKAKTGKLTFTELEKVAFQNRDWGEFDVERIRNIFEWHLVKNINEQDPKFANFGESIWRYNIDRLGAIQFIANAVIDRFEPPPIEPAVVR